MADLSKFLTKFYKCEQLRKMKKDDFERWARLDDWMRKGDTNLDSDINDWVKLIKPNGNLFEIIKLDAKELDDAEWEKLFYIYQGVFLNLVENYDKLNKETKEFVDTNKEFFKKHAQAKEQLPSKSADKGVEAGIEFVKKVLNDHKINEKTLRDFTGDDKANIADYVKQINDEQYNKDPAFQKKFKRLVDNLQNDIFYAKEKYELDESTVQEANQKLTYLQDWKKTGLASDNLDKFKKECLKEDGLLDTLHKKSKVLEDFKKHETEDKSISAAIESAEKKVDYEKKVPPKREDQLSFPQQIEKMAADTFENYLEKYVKFKGDRIYVNPASRDICKAIDKAKFKPTDGLDDLIAKSGDISKRLASTNNARVSFEWLTEKLKMFQADPQMSKAFKGALKNGWQLKHLVRELIAEADREANAKPEDRAQIIEKAKIALETLSIIKYANTTSKIMDTLRTDESLKTLFSNDKLSWNKNEGVQFITKAIDKTIHAAFVGIGYGITIGVNTIRKAGSKFNGNFGNDKTGKMMKENQRKFQQEKAAEMVAAKKEKGNIATGLQSEQKNRANALNELGLKDDDKLKAGLKLKEQELSDAGSAEKSSEETYKKWQNNYETASEQARQFDEQLAQRQQIEVQIQSISEMIKDGSLEEEEKNHLLHQRVELRQQLKDMPSEDEINKGRADLNLTHLQMGLDSAKYQYDEAIKSKNDKQAKLDRFRNAEKEIKNWEEKEKANNEKIAALNDKDNKNNISIYQELMSYWDFLETGRDSHTGPLYDWSLGSAKNKSNVNAVKQLQIYQQNYGMRA